MANPLINLGTLNRVRASVVFPSFTALNITSSQMGRRFVSLTFDEDFVQQIQQGVGIINSPEPYVMATVTCDVLRTLPLAQAFISQLEQTAVLGTVYVHSDTRTFPKRTVYNASVLKADPGAYDGINGVLALTIRGVFYPNNTLWNFV
jgi:hypothetical protein